jgi:hypothetical protein
MFIRSAVLIVAIVVAQAVSAQPGPRIARIGYLTASHPMENDPLALAFLRGRGSRLRAGPEHRRARRLRVVVRRGQEQHREESDRKMRHRYVSQSTYLWG